MFFSCWLKDLHSYFHSASRDSLTLCNGLDSVWKAYCALFPLEVFALAKSICNAWFCVSKSEFALGLGQLVFISFLCGFFLEFSGGCLITQCG